MALENSSSSLVVKNPASPELIFLSDWQEYVATYAYTATRTKEEKCNKTREQQRGAKRAMPLILRSTNDALTRRERGTKHRTRNTAVKCHLVSFFAHAHPSVRNITAITRRTKDDARNMCGNPWTHTLSNGTTIWMKAHGCRMTPGEAGRP